MEILNKYLQPPLGASILTDDKRAWLRAHPTWMIEDGYVTNLLNPAECDPRALAEFPGSFWLNLNRATGESLVWISGMSGLTGLLLQRSEVGDDEFTNFIKNACHLRHLDLQGLNGLTDVGLRHIANLSGLESLQIFCDENEDFNAAFLAGLAGDNSPVFLDVSGYKEMSDVDLAHISKWKRLVACSLILAPDARDDLPWLAELKNLRCLQLEGKGSLTRSGLVRLATLPELCDLELNLDMRDAAVWDALALLSKLEDLSIHIKGGCNVDAHLICGEIAQCSSIRNLTIQIAHDNSLFDITTSDLANLATMPKLEKLTCEGECRQEPDFDVLGVATHLKKIEHPYSIQPTDRGLSGLAKITGLTRLTVAVADCTCQGLALLSALPHLAELILWEIENLDAADLACLADFPALTALTLHFNGNNDLPMQSFAFLRNMASLTSLTVDERGEWNEAMLDDIAATPGLRRLFVHALWDLPGAWLGKLKQLPLLEEISLIHCLGFSDKNLFRLAGIETLRRLELHDCDNISIKGLLRLRHLPLEEIRINGLRHFTPLSGQELMAVRLAWPEAVIL